MAGNAGMASSTGIGKKPGVFAWLLLIPLLLWLGVFVLGPNLIMLAYSIGKPNSLGQVVFSKVDASGKSISQVSTENYARILSLPEGFAIAVAILIGAIFGIAVWMGIKKSNLVYNYGKSAFFAAVCIGGSMMWIALNAYVLEWRLGPIAFTSIFPFTQVEQDVSWLKIFVISINYAATSTAICVIAGYPVAYFIGKAPEKWRNALLMLVMVPFWTSFLVRTYAWVTILRSQGILNQFLGWIGAIDPNNPLDLWPSQTGVMIGLVYTYLPFMILPIYTSIERLDNAFVEAAFDLGASPLRAFNNVIFPLTRPGVIAGILLVFVPAVGMFAVNDILGGHNEMLIGNVIEQQFTKAKNPPFGAALGVTLMVLFVVFYYLMTRRRDAIAE